MPQTPVFAGNRGRRRTPVPASRAATPSSDRFLRSRNTPRLEPSFLQAVPPTAAPSPRPFTRSCVSTPRHGTTTGTGNVVIFADQPCPDFDSVSQQLRRSLPRKASSRNIAPPQNEETPITKRIRQVLRGGVHNTPLASASASALASASASASALALQSRKRRYDDQETPDDLEELYTSDTDSQRNMTMPMHRRNRVPQTPKFRKTVVATKHRGSEKEGSNSESLIWKYFKTEAVVNKSRGRNRADRYPMVCTYFYVFPNRHLNSMFRPFNWLFR
jgi:hypothetical protein